jgi:histidyl-tRNA synthetase
LVPSHFNNNPDVVLLGVSDEFNFSLLSFMEPLINADLKVEILYTGSMSKKFKRANKINASFAIILGEEEVKMKILKLKNLITGTEEPVNIREAVNVIKTFLNK